MTHFAHSEQPFLSRKARSGLIFGISLLSLLLTNCRKKEEAAETQLASVLSTSVQETLPAKISLPTVDKYPGKKKIVYETVIEMRDRPGFDKYSPEGPIEVRTQSFGFYVVRFPSLDKDQFEYLKKIFAWGGSRIKYKEGTPYKLTDFLSPAISALDGTWGSNKEAEGEGATFTNCWGTAYELMTRDAENFSQYVMAPSELIEVLDDKRYFDVIPEGAPLKFGDIALDTCRKCGPVIVDLSHAVIIVDGNLVFEKNGMGVGQHRLTINEGYAPSSGSKNKKSLAMAADGERISIWRRPKKSIPEPEAQFHQPMGMFEPNLKQPILIRNLKLMTDDLGRTRLESQSPSN